jgi:hypothetical protein
MCHPVQAPNKEEEPRAALRFVLRRADDGNFVRELRILQQAWTVKEYVPDVRPGAWGAWETYTEWRDVPLVDAETVDAENRSLAAAKERRQLARTGATHPDDTGAGAGVREPVPVGQDNNNGVLPEQ